MTDRTHSPILDCSPRVCPPVISGVVSFYVFVNVSALAQLD